MKSDLKSKATSGGARMAAAGYQPVQIWLRPEDKEKLFEAAKASGQKATQFLVFHGLMAAEKILKKSAKVH